MISNASQVPTGFDDARRISYQQLGPGSGGQLDAGADDVWGILGVGLMPWDVKMYETLKKQDYMYARRRRNLRDTLRRPPPRNIRVAAAAPPRPTAEDLHGINAGTRS